MNQFVISVKKDGRIFNQFNKVFLNLNTSQSIVGQAEQKVVQLLSTNGLEKDSMDGMAWKIYRFDGRKYSFVSCSGNWVGD